MTVEGLPPENRRQKSLTILSGAHRAELQAAWETLAPEPSFETVRGPDTGLVMLRGRIGGGGAPFNLGEAAVSQCVVSMEGGHIGIGYVLGRDPVRAELVARFDALLQSDRYRDAVDNILLAPVAARMDADDQRKRREAAATRVGFFTLVRGEDP